MLFVPAPIWPRSRIARSRRNNSAPPNTNWCGRPCLLLLSAEELRCAADQILSSWYGAAGANVSIPVFNGFEYTARAKEADLRANAAQEQVRNLRDNIARDVRAAVLNAEIAFQRIGVTQELLNQANTALELAQARYKVGLSGIVDLTQSQLAQTEALIGLTNARYTYQIALAIVRYQTGQ